jgi:hypothetical protein
MGNLVDVQLGVKDEDGIGLWSDIIDGYVTCRRMRMNENE